MSDIHHHLSVCSQFDIQYPELTDEEHLLFYARLKGVKLGRAGRVVERALRQVTLTMDGLEYCQRNYLNLRTKILRHCQLLNYVDINRNCHFCKVIDSTTLL